MAARCRASLLFASLVLAAAAYDVNAPTDQSCLGGCSCVPRLRAVVPTAPSKDMRVFALSLESLAKHAVDV